MSLFTILNLFLLPSLITILLVGALLNLRYTRNNIYRNYLVSMQLFWATIMTSVYIKFFAQGGVVISYTRDIASIEVLLLGIPCFLSFVSLPLIILNARLLKASRWLKPFSPVGIAILIYFFYHLVAGIDPFTKYTSLADLAEHAFSISFALRIAVIVIYCVYLVKYLTYIWKTVPLYNEYIQNNISDSDCNVEWIRKLVLCICGVCVMYFIMLFFSHPIVNFFYLISLIITFTFLLEMSLFRRVSEHIEHIKFIRLPNSKEWIVEDENFLQKEAMVKDEMQKDTYTSIIEDIDKWMEESKAYTHIDFTTSDIVNQFPNLTQYELSTLFKEKNETFQAYIRRYRIIRACEIMKEERETVFPKQVFDRVGFSHYSSFSRSFVAVTRLTPSTYMKLSNKDQEALIAAIRKEFTTPCKTQDPDISMS